MLRGIIVYCFGVDLVFERVVIFVVVFIWYIVSCYIKYLLFLVYDKNYIWIKWFWILFLVNLICFVDSNRVKVVVVILIWYEFWILFV